jgi:hypothetical protein
VKEKLKLLRERLGIDLSDGAVLIQFRSANVAAATLPVGGLATTTEDALARINASPYVKRELAEGDVYIHTLEAGSTRFIADRFMFLDETSIRNVAEEARAGFAFMTRHATGAGFTDGELPYGRVFAGDVDTQDGVRRVVVQLYMLRNHRPNGTVNTDDLDKGMVGGTLFDVSLGFKRAGLTLRCDVCEKPLFGSDCPHFPGTHMAMSEDDIARQAARGVPEGRASMTLVDGVPGEISLVYSGAIPGAGTAFAEQGELPADDVRVQTPPTPSAIAQSDPQKPTPEPQVQHTAQAREEETMYPKELKLKLGLAETATDADVEAKLASLSSAAAENETLKADKKKAEDAAFTEKWKGKLGEDGVALILSAPNRDELAEKFAGKLAAAPAPQRPPIGDPLAGAALAAAPDVTPSAGATEQSEIVRKGLGVFASNGDLEKAAMTAPLDALKKCLGLKTLQASPDLLKYDEQALAQRRVMYGITQTVAA